MQSTHTHSPHRIPGALQDEIMAALRAAIPWAPVLLGFAAAGTLLALLFSVFPSAVSAHLMQETEIHMPVPSEPAAEATAQEGLAALFTPQIKVWEPQILRWASEYDLDPNLIATVMQIESCGHPGVHSGAGAAGLFQVMPFHFHAGESPLDPETNAQRGLSYLRRALELAQGNPDLALAGYNGGHGVIEWSPDAWPAETQRYVYWGSGIFEDATQGKEGSERLQAWLNAGGSSLCQRSTMALQLDS